MATDNRNLTGKRGSAKNKLNVHPVLEAGVILVKFLVLITAGLVFILSLMAKAEWYSVAIRTSLAMVIVGLLGWYVNWMLGRWVVRYEMRKLEEKAQQVLDDLYIR